MWVPSASLNEKTKSGSVRAITSTATLDGERASIDSSGVRMTLRFEDRSRRKK